MAFKTLDQLRTDGLNDELGLTGDGDTTWGSTSLRNRWLQKAIARLWPRLGRLTRESLTSGESQMDYTLATLYDIERIEVMDSADSDIVRDRIRSWQIILDEAADPPTRRLLLPTMTPDLTLRVIGYVPYTIPASGATSTDIPPRLEWLVIAGAAVEAYRWQLNRFANFERFQNENRQNSLTPADIVELLRQARTDFERGLTENGRKLSGARRAQLTTG